MTFAGRMSDLSTRLLSKYGSTISLVRAGAKTWDSNAGEYVFSASTSIPLNAVPVPIQAGLVDGTTIQSGDVMLKADGLVKPELTDKVSFNGAQWSIVGIESKIINDVTIAYFIQVRK